MQPVPGRPGFQQGRLQQVLGSTAVTCQQVGGLQQPVVTDRHERLERGLLLGASHVGITSDW